MKSSTFLLSVLSVTLLSSCGGTVLPPLPGGEQTVTGILKAAELSAVRRGSHIIEQEGVDVYYAESSLINLREYQTKRVTLRGNFEHNTNPEDLPVLVAESVVDVEETSEEHVLSVIGVTLTTPVQWRLVKREGKYQFHLEEEDDGALLTVWQEVGTLLPDGGVPIVVDATRATRLIDDLSGTHIVAVKREGKILHLRFSPGTRANADRLREDFIEVLNSIELKSTGSSGSNPSFGTGSLGTPCGGSAGILCPEGSFCDVQSFEDNVGKCRKL
ncbi:MAG: hypothetical protein HOG89_01545 [Candidatus Peribacter sp.]|jgi:hypothetical protein|nr:hypothetical protein [Candidatus Peribacter sp.]MBT4392493.1 hypothetical protein [Candidatus Peribacter sp.]MBT4601322.1 hypothetical protein [Candidatus Peribacter sp.]MBT5149226.1 hypothetical protein [Candidatus Peribacter sp.]MBT5638048.1 hypothetical protein [Candidatus Peribacter sp.]